MDMQHVNQQLKKTSVVHSEKKAGKDLNMLKEALKKDSLGEGVDLLESSLNLMASPLGYEQDASRRGLKSEQRK